MLLSDGFDVSREPAPGPDDVATASEDSCRSGQGGGREAEMSDGGIVPVLAQPASTAPTYRRSLFCR